MASAGTKRWSLAGDERLLQLKGIGDDELAALDMGIRRAEREGALTEARALETLRDRLVILAPRREVRRAEADAEASLQARGFAARPGPNRQYDPAILEVIDFALKGPFKLELIYLAKLTTRPVSEWSSLRRLVWVSMLSGLPRAHRS